MNIADLPFGTVDWNAIDPIVHPGAMGEAHWRTRHFGNVRVRVLEYSAGYLADHWCTKGHFLFCLEGELETELADGRRFTLRPGMSYHVADGAEPHRSSTRMGARLYVVD
ncbi:MAG TPA: DHCW motif cupin fold protein [Steroidobacteraceae bacterium]|nr:DHCW motif cupin fold protein [Steroidobacteraceae bacterium]